jgi:hypothetical protein
MADFHQEFDGDILGSPASKELRDRLIASYEHALNNGLTPTCALSVVLSWIAEECARVRADTP